MKTMNLFVVLSFLAGFQNSFSVKGGKLKKLNEGIYKLDI